MKGLILIVFIFKCTSIQATTYYLSERGKDELNGMSFTAPWRSLEKISFRKLKSGDSILFERGSTFIGQLNILQSNIYVGAYGTGNKPIIQGAISIDKWEYIDKHIWKSSCTVEPSNLYINGNPQPIGRYPNNGYLKLSSIKSPTLIIGSFKLFEDGYWNESEMVVKSSRWTLDRLPVNNFTNNTFTTSISSTYPLQSGYGFFIQNHLNTLDKPGEWFFNSRSNELYIYWHENITPSKMYIEISFHEYGLTIQGVENVTIENVTFIKYNIGGIFVNNSRNTILNNVEVFHSGKNAIEVISCERPIVQHSLFSDSGNNGVNWHNNNNGIFFGNKIIRTGLQPGRGESGNGTYIALHITSDKPNKKVNHFESNTVDSVGYSGIDFRTGNTIIKNNRIRNFCMVKDDGGGIYTWQNKQTGNIIENNIISKGTGSGEGTFKPFELYASGIYIDDRSRFILIRNNKISDCATSGIYLHNAKNIIVKGNIVMDNGYNISNKDKGQLYIKIDRQRELDDNLGLELTVIDNKWMATHENSYCVYLSADKKVDLNQMGTFNNNHFTSCFSYQAIAESYNESKPCASPQEYALAQWQKNSGLEINSTHEIACNRYFTTIGNNLITNSTMTSGIGGWTIWPEEQTLIHDKVQIGKGSALKVLIDPSNTEGLVYHAGISIFKKQLYRLSFSAWSDKPVSVEFVLLMANSPWGALGDYTCFQLNSKSKTFTYYFMAYETSAQSRVNFKSNNSFWLDNVTLHQIVGRIE